MTSAILRPGCGPRQEVFAMRKLGPVISVMALLLGSLAASAATCANPAQAPPNFSGNGPGVGGSYPLAAGATLPVTWTPSPTAGCATTYTLDGTAPSASSLVYTGQTLNLTQTTTVLMVATGAGMTSSAQQGGTYTIAATSTPPVAAATATTATACGMLPVGQTCAQAFGHSCVNLSWTPGAGSSAAASVTLLRSIASSGPWMTVTTGAPSAGPCLDTTVVNGQSYFYEAEAVVNGATSPPSNINSIAIPSNTVKPSIALSVSPSAATADESVTVTVSVTGTPTPTGSIALSGGGVSQALALVNGQASFSIASGGLTIGADSLTAVYAPDSASAAVYAAVTATASIVVSPGPPAGLSGIVVQ